MNKDNLLPQLLQNAMARAYPSPLPSNQILTEIASPDDPTALGDALTLSVVDETSLVYGALVEFGGSADWTAAAMVNTSATLAPGSVVLAAGQTSGTATTAAIDLTVAVVIGASLTVYVNDLEPFAGTATAYQIRFSADGATWGAWQALANGDTFTALLRYAQVQATLTSTTAGLTPQVNTLTFSVASPARWGRGEWALGGFAFVAPNMVVRY